MLAHSCVLRRQSEERGAAVLRSLHLRGKLLSLFRKELASLSTQSPLWRDLKRHRARVLSERTVSQWAGFIVDRIKESQSKRAIEQRQQHKTLYHVR